MPVAIRVEVSGLLVLEALESAEEEIAFDGGILVAVATMHSVFANILRIQLADGTFGCLLRISCTDEGTEISYCIVLFKDGSNDGT